MYKKMVPFIITLGLILFSGCGSKMDEVNIKTYTDKKSNLEGYETYSWLTTTSLVVDEKNAFHKRDYNVQDFIQSKINKELLDYDKIESTDNPDFLVSYIVGIDMGAIKEKVNDDGKKYLDSIPEAGIAIVMIDPSNKRVIYAATAEAQLNESLSDEESKERIVDAIEDMLDDL